MIEWLHIILPETEVAAVALLIPDLPNISYYSVRVCVCVYVCVRECM